MKNKSKAKPKRRPARLAPAGLQPVIWSGSEDLRPLLVPITSLLPDPKNARTHGPVNSERIGKSLAKFGQQKPISVDDQSIIVAGNGTWQEAIKLGWTHIARVRTQLAGAMVTAYGLADNVTSDSAGWDPDQFHQNIDELEKADLQLDELGLDLGDDELKGMFDELVTALDPASIEEKAQPKAPGKRSAGTKAPDPDAPDLYGVIVYLPNEVEQAAFLEEMETRQLKHKAL